MNDHDWLHENLDAYLAGGLDLDERLRAEAHLADCADCAQLHQNAQGMENYMANLFADARPDAALEDRLIGRLGVAPKPYPAWRRFAVAVAAMIVVGFVGGIVQAVALEGGVPYLQESEGVHLHGARRGYFGLIHGHVDHGKNYLGSTFSSVGGKIGGVNTEDKAEKFGVRDLDSSALELDTDIQYMADRVADISVPGSVNPNEALGIRGGGKNAPPLNLPAPGGFANKGQSRELRGWSNDRNEKPVGEIGGYSPDGKQLAGAFFGRSPEARESEKKPAAALYYYGIAPLSDDTGKKLGATPMPKETTLSIGGLKANKQEKKSFNFGLPGEKQAVVAQPGPEADPGLKIIRTGEIEFQVDSFDDAVTKVVKLIAAVKGGFKLKEDSTKQTNGKTRGYVVVRVPPQFLDQFVLDLRRDLAKMGADLRTQKIGSQDVTKQYTDTASELRAARAVEGRLIEIIKTGKGEVKDLIAAERELGTWRTKIEKMEGEIRYYNNQVSLSTLTIQLVEKEIEAASALVVNSTVQMRIETEDVSKARQTAEKAVADLKGRLIKSDEKQHAAGQIEAILHADIPPASKDAFKQALSKLGIVSASQARQAQTTEGGSGQVLKLTPQVKDVRFEVTLMNIVNIMPKYSVALDLATTDVSANFAKLKDEVLRLQGQVRTATKNEADKRKITAQISFNVPKEHKAAMDKLIAEIGPVLKRDASQAAVTDIATDQKYGYAVNLYSVAVIAPRETVTLHIEVKDVETTAAEMLALARTSKGQANKVKSRIDPQGRRSSKLVMVVPLSASDALVKQFMAEGKVIDKDQTPNTQVQENELSTAHLIVELTGGSPIVPSDEGMSGYMRRSLYLGYTILVIILTFLLTGLIVLVPCGLVAWVGYRAFSRLTGPGKPAPLPNGGDAKAT